MTDAVIPLACVPTWSVPIIISFGTTAGVIVAAIASGIVLVIKELHNVGVTAGKIEVAVNSEKTASQGREVNLMNENKILREFINENKLAASLLAQSVASSTKVVTVENK
jgi:hypothetical protein